MGPKRPLSPNAKKSRKRKGPSKTPCEPFSEDRNNQASSFVSSFTISASQGEQNSQEPSDVRLAPVTVPQADPSFAPSLHCSPMPSPFQYAYESNGRSIRDINRRLPRLRADLSSSIMEHRELSLSPQRGRSPGPRDFPPIHPNDRFPGLLSSRLKEQYPWASDMTLVSPYSGNLPDSVSTNDALISPSISASSAEERLPPSYLYLRTPREILESQNDSDSESHNNPNNNVLFLYTNGFTQNSNGSSDHSEEFMTRTGTVGRMDVDVLVNSSVETIEEDLDSMFSEYTTLGPYEFPRSQTANSVSISPHKDSGGSLKASTKSNLLAPYVDEDETESENETESE